MLLKGRRQFILMHLIHFHYFTRSNGYKPVWFLFQRFTFCDVFKTEKWILTLFGFYPVKESLSTWRTVSGTLNFIVSIVITALIIVPAFSTDYYGIIKSSRLWVTEIAFIAKLIIFIYHKKTILNIEEALQKPLLRTFSKDSLKYVFKDIKFTQRFCNFYRYNIFFCILFILSAPFLDRTSRRSLPYDAFSPCPLAENYCFYGFFIFQVFYLYSTSSVNINMELMFSCLMTIICCLFDILKNNLENIDYTKKHSFTELRTNIIFHIEISR